MTTRTADEGPLDITCGDGTPGTKLLRLSLAKRWHLVLVNTDGDNTITGLRIRRYPKAGGDAGPWETITADLPIAAGGAYSVRETDDCSDELEVEITASAADTVVRATLVGV